MNVDVLESTSDFLTLQIPFHKLVKNICLV